MQAVLRFILKSTLREKGEYFTKYLAVCKIFKNYIQYLFDDLHEVVMGLRNEKNNILLHNIYILFFLKTVADKL